MDIETIQRIHDEFTFSRYRKAASDAQFYDTEFMTLREASAFFPEVDGVGIYNDIEAYFNAWKDIEKNSGRFSPKASPSAKDANANHKYSRHAQSPF